MADQVSRRGFLARGSAVAAGLALSGTAGAAGLGGGETLPPREGAGGMIRLAEGGRTEYVIVVPDQPTTQEQKASGDLAEWLREMTEAEFTIVGDSAPRRPREICVGATNRLAEAGLADLTAGLGDEGYAIEVAGERLFLVGGRLRGPIYATYALLEEDLGLRWYTPTATHVPRRPTVVFAPRARRSLPALVIRDPFYKAAFDGTWSLRNRTNAPDAPVPEEWGGHVTYALFVHTFNTLVPPGEHFESHPEYYMLDAKGNRSPQQLCTTHPEVIRIATESALRILRERPTARVISVSKNDGGGTCLCDRCRALDEAEGTNAAALLYMVNRVAEAIEDEFPEVTVSTLAYLETIKPPKTVQPRRNVAIRLCTDNCMWAHPFTPVRESEAFREAIEGWAAICKQIHIWDYCVNFSHYTAPMPNLDVIADNIRYFVANNAKGVMEQGAYQSVGAERDALRSWVLAKLMWDPSRDLRALEEDFIRGYFGPAALPLLEYNRLLRQAGETHAEELRNPPGGIRYGMDHPFLSDEFLQRADELYDRALRLAGDGEIRARVERDRLPILYVKLCRGREYVGPGYDELIDEFERISREVGLTHIYEGPPDVEARIAAWREVVER